MRLVREISHDNNNVRSSPAYNWQSAAIRAVQEMIIALLIWEFESEILYVFSYTKAPIDFSLEKLMCAVHADHVKITPRDLEIISSLHIRND
jgi:hypothetical protein